MADKRDQGAAPRRSRIRRAGLWLSRLILGLLLVVCGTLVVVFSFEQYSLLPLTDDLDEFNTEIDKLTAGGSTAGHLGVAWSWYLIAPAWKSIWPSESEPLAYTEPNTIKAVILMTDGKFNQSYESTMGNSNKQAKKMCKKMRNENVRIYAVAFKAPESAKKTLKYCTGDDSLFFDAGNGAELLAAYDAIASQLSALTLVN